MERKKPFFATPSTMGINGLIVFDRSANLVVNSSWFGRILCANQPPFHSAETATTAAAPPPEAAATRFYFFVVLAFCHWFGFLVYSQSRRLETTLGAQKRDVIHLATTTLQDLSRCKTERIRECNATLSAACALSALLGWDQRWRHVEGRLLPPRRC